MLLLWHIPTQDQMMVLLQIIDINIFWMITLKDMNQTQITLDLQDALTAVAQKVEDVWFQI